MEEVLTAPGLQHIAERICKYLEPDSFQKLIVTCKGAEKFSAIISDRWLKKCQDKGLCLDESWTNALKDLKAPELKFYLGIICHRINYECPTNDSKSHPLAIMAKCGQANLLKVLLHFRYKLTGQIIPMYHEFYKGILETLMGKFEKIKTFKAFSEVLESFLKHDEGIIKKLLETASKKDSKEIKKILELLLNKPDSLGHTPMHTYAYHGNLKQNIEIVKFAAPICLSPNHQDNFGATPKHIALEKGHLEIVKALIPKWDNRKAKNHENKTAFQIAKEKGHKEIMKLMIENTLE